MRQCAKAKGYSTCADCADMPCEKLQVFCGDGAPHHAEVIENLKRIREVGEGEFAGEQEKKWSCGCGQRLSWYLRECPECKNAERNC